MATCFRPLSSIKTQQAQLERRTHSRPLKVSLDDSALLVMTDLRENNPFTVQINASIEAANDIMIACGVRLLFVIESDRLCGLITANDILGEKPVQYLIANGGTRQDIAVKHIMTPQHAIDALYYRDVRRAYVGDIVQTLKQLARQHTLVIDTNAQGIDYICGMFSSTQISRQLSTELEISNRAQSFAEIERVVVSGVPV